jgi:hypothetical protein
MHGALFLQVEDPESAVHRHFVHCEKVDLARRVQRRELDVFYFCEVMRQLVHDDLETSKRTRHSEERCGEDNQSVQAEQ